MKKFAKDERIFITLSIFVYIFITAAPYEMFH